MPSLRLVAVSAAEFGGRRDAARLIEQHAPDVACLHGAPRLLRWRSACAAIARDANLVVVAGGRTGGGSLLLSDLGVDVDGLEETRFGPVALSSGAVVAAMRRLGAPFLLAAGRVPAGDGARFADALHGVVPDPRPALLCLAGDVPPELAAGRVPLPGGVLADESLPVSDVVEIDGGVRVDLTLPD